MAWGLEFSPRLPCACRKRRLTETGKTTNGNKKGNRQEPGDYRPISLTSVVCKTMERLIKGKIITHLEGNNLIGDSQHGFRKTAQLPNKPA